MSQPKPKRRPPSLAKRAYPNLVTWREAHGLNQHQAAKILGFSQTAYSRLERGKKIPVRQDAKRLMAKTGVPLEVLVGVA